MLTRSKSSSKSREEPRMRRDLTDAARGASHDRTALMLTCRGAGGGLLQQASQSGEWHVQLTFA